MISTLWRSTSELSGSLMVNATYGPRCFAHVRELSAQAGPSATAQGNGLFGGATRIAAKSVSALFLASDTVTMSLASRVGERRLPLDDSTQDRTALLVIR